MSLCAQRFALVFAAVSLAVAAADSAKSSTAPSARSVEVTGKAIPVLWRDPVDLAARDLFWGPGGKDRSPRAPFTFVSETSGGTNPKFIVRDARGVRWLGKLGPEARAETAATRLVWAVGYFADDDYLVPALRVANMPARLRRGGKVVAADGSIPNVRLERLTAKPAGRWQWRQSPFNGSRELNGLRVMMALLNNWDLKDSNNAIALVNTAGSAPRRIYSVSDLGSTFGTTGITLPYTRAKGNLDSYTHSRFVQRASDRYVDFSVPTMPNPILCLFAPHTSIPRFRQRWIGRQIPRSDVHWIGQILARLSPQQIRDAFRAAGYSPREVDAFTEIVRTRIAVLGDL